MITGQATVRTHGTKIVVMGSYITNPTHTFCARNVHVTNNVSYDGVSGTPWESVVGNYITRTLSGNTGFAYQPAGTWNGTGTYQ